MQYYDVSAFDWGTSLNKIKLFYLLNRQYKKSKETKLQDGTAYVVYSVLPEENRTEVIFRFRDSKLEDAVYRKTFDGNSGFSCFDFYLGRVKELSKRYGQPDVSEQDPKAKKANSTWRLPRTEIMCTLNKGKDDLLVCDVQYKKRDGILT
jgi:hypothetical protein